MTDTALPLALIVVPARYGSTRLPGKPLLPVAGRTLLERVTAIACTAAKMAGNCEVVVATDHPRIADHVHAIGTEVVMTAPDIDSGSSRAYVAALARSARPELVINLQGDAPFVPPAVVVKLITTLRAQRNQGGEVDVATPVYPLEWDRLDHLRAHKQATPFSGTTCIRAKNGQALWFSKAIIPVLRDEAKLRAVSSVSPVWQHLGVYGYRMAALEWFVTAPQSAYEKLEGLEQLRFLEGGRTIATVEVEPPTHVMSGIDTPADLALAEEVITRLGDPFPN